jgi:large subunit ribosomal protein L23
MAIFDIFKKKKEKAPRGTPKKSLKAAPKETPKAVSQEKTEIVPKKEIKKPRKSSGIVCGVVKSPHISEKATNLEKLNRYVFKVFPRANKNEIKKAIESIYGVDVLAVNIIKIPAKKRRLGKTAGFKGGYKKAIIKIKEGQKIEIV